MIRLVALLALAAAVLAAPAAGHAPRGCAFPKPQPPVGHWQRVYAVPHGCVRLEVPANETRLPAVVVARHGPTGPAATRRFALPRSTLGSTTLGLCGPPTAFVVRWPFVTVVAQRLVEYGDSTTCLTELADALLWTLRLEVRDGRLVGHWWTHRP